MKELLVYFACLYQGDYTKIKQAIEKEEHYDLKTIRQTIHKIRSLYVTILDEDYPKQLLELKEPPFVLFYYGNLNLVNEHSISMIGMRECSDYGKRVAQQLTHELREDFVIVSGMAKGIDGICHRFSKKTIAVLGCGIDYCYPKENLDLYQKIKNDGLLLSEYPGLTPPKPYYFPWRNRIVAALGQGVVVVEAKKKSGTMITVGYALDLGKPIFAVPCRIDDFSGTIGLIKDGAYCLESVVDIYEVLNLNKIY